jgi:prepilin-type N-terminal cleavage/methylation domain-containing protein
VIDVKRLTAQDGMTLVELLIAMLVMSIGIFAIVAGLSSGILTISRAAKASSAGAVADDQMESFRGISYAAIATTATPTDGVYENTAAPYSSPYDATWKIATLGSCASNYCTPTRTVSASGGSYRVDTYVRWQCPAAATPVAGSPPTCPVVVVGSVAPRAVKQVTIVVRNASDPTKTLFSETSNFDALTG